MEIAKQVAYRLGGPEGSEMERRNTAQWHVIPFPLRCGDPGDLAYDRVKGALPLQQPDCSSSAAKRRVENRSEPNVRAQKCYL